MKLKKYQLKRTKSTNDVAVKKIKAGINNGIVITETQTKGRGQYGNKWISYGIGFSGKWKINRFWMKSRSP